MTPVPKRLFALLVASAGSLTLAGPALADVYDVNSTADTTVCNSTTCTLRGAIATSQAVTQTDPAVVINLAEGATYETGSRLDIDDTDNTYTIEGENSTIRAKAGTTHGLFAISTQVEFDNMTLSGGRSDFGAALASDNADMIVDGVTMTDNTATGSGGAIGLGRASTLDMVDSTLTGNAAPFGSAVAFDTSEALTVPTDGIVGTVNQTTVSGNTGGGKAISFVGDDDDDASNDGTVRLTRTIVGGGCQVFDTGDPVVVNATIKDGGSNLETGNTCGLATGSNATDLKLSALRSTFFGGPQVLVPLPASPAIDSAGTGCTDSDERLQTFVGSPFRPVDGDSNGSALCDVGAVEFKPARRTVKEGATTETAAAFKVDVTNGDAPVKVRIVYGPGVDNYPNAAEFAVPYTTDTASVDANLSGLTPGTVYEYRVQLVDGGSTVQGANGSFRTKYVPATSVTNTTGIGETTATLNGRVDDNSLPGVKYHFEYGTTTDYGTSTPEADAAINQTSVAVSAPVTGLAAGTKYHVRTVVRYDGRTFVSGDEVFTTKAAAVISQPTLKATLGSLGKVKLKKTRKYGVGVTCSLDCSLTATLSTTRKVAKRLKLKRVLAKASGSGKAGAASKLTFKLTRKLRAKLRAKKVRSLKLTVTARSGTAAPVTMTGTVKLKR